MNEVRWMEVADLRTAKPGVALEFHAEIPRGFTLCRSRSAISLLPIKMPSNTSQPASQPASQRCDTFIFTPRYSCSTEYSQYSHHPLREQEDGVQCR
jgi:hypothetical protein